MSDLLKEIIQRFVGGLIVAILDGLHLEYRCDNINRMLMKSSGARRWKVHMIQRECHVR